MKKNIKILTKELESLQKLNANPISLQNSSISSIIKYRYRLHKEKKLKTEILKLNLEKRRITKKFDNQIEGWLNDNKISARKYCKLEPKAIYKKEKILYKLGYLSKRPLSPTEKFLKQKFSPIITFFKSIISNIPIHKLNPKKHLTNIAIHTTKSCIKGFKKIENLKFSAKKSILENSLIKKIKNIKAEALKQLEEESIISAKQINTADSDFISSIKITPSPILKNSNINHQRTFTKDLPMAR